MGAASLLAGEKRVVALGIELLCLLRSGLECPSCLVQKAEDRSLPHGHGGVNAVT